MLLFCSLLKMGKRKVDLDEESPHRKRKRLTKEQAPKPEVPNIESSKDLQLLLRFEQDAGPQTRQSEVQGPSVDEHDLTVT